MCRSTTIQATNSAPYTGFSLMSIAQAPETHSLLSGNVPSLVHCHFSKTIASPQSMRVTPLALFDSSPPWA